MKEINLEKLLNILESTTKESVSEEDYQKVHYVCEILKNVRINLPTMIELDKLQKEIVYLEEKYDLFNELSYYFGPLYVNIKQKIHDEYVKKLREDNRRKKHNEL